MPLQHRVLRVLLLEDNPDDAALLEHELGHALAREGLTMQVDVADDRAPFEARLRGDLDLIIADHSLPQFDALAALALVHERALDIPFIIVSGVISEDAAVEAMRRGAADYLLKDRLARLGQAVRNALAERQHREEKERAAEAIRRSEALNRSVLASLPAHIAVLDDTGRIISVNEAWETAVARNACPTLVQAGVGTDYLAGCRAAADAGDEWARQACGGIQDVIHRRRPQFRMTYPCSTPAPPRWFEMNVISLYGEARSGVVVSHADVTERRRAEETSQRLAAIVSSSDDAILSLSPDGIITSWNRGAERLYGYTAAEIVGRSVDLILPEAHRPIMAAALEQIGRGESIRHLETVRIAKGGRAIDVSLTLSPMQDATGRVTGASSIARDISERKQAQNALQESEARYRLLAEHATDLITRTTPEGICLYVSPACRALLGYAPEELVGRPYATFMHPDDLAAIQASRPAELTGPTTYTVSYRARHKDGPYVWLESTGRVVWDERTNAVSEIISVSRDVTERKEYERQLIEAREHAEAMNRLKSTFLTNMSHEIRTPLTGILGYAEILAETATGESVEFAEMIHKSGIRLMETLNSVLDLAQLEGGGIQIRKEPLDLGRRVKEAFDLFKPQLVGSGLSVTMHLPDQPVVALADRGALDRILTNLLSNAIKFTHVGGVTVTVTEREGRGLIHVTDTGVGISRAFFPKLFQEFEQESTGLGRDFEGSGLGLAISRRLATLMDGAILIESEKGEGSTFTVQLPLARQAEPSRDRPEQDRVPTTRQRILLVEDNPETQQIFTHLLGPVHDLTVAGTAQEALDLLGSARFDTAILDINLCSSMTGEDVLHYLRAQPEHRTVQAIACTAYALPSDAERFLSAGFDAHLPKPFTRAQLFATLEAVRAAAGERGASSGNQPFIIP